MINVKKALKAERINTDKTDTPLTISTEYELFMSPKGETVKYRVAEIRKELETKLIDEIKRIGSSESSRGLGLHLSTEVPPRIVEMIKQGWFPYRHNKFYRPDETKIFWFDCFCGFFQQKLTGEIGDVFQNRLLTNLTIGEDAPLELREDGVVERTFTFEVFKTELKTIGDGIFERFDQVDLRFDSVDEDLKDIKQLLTEVVGILKNKPATLPNSIPPSIGFVGREDDYLREIREQYKNKCRIFVFHGISGVGKTALALRFANEIADEYQEKIFICW